MTHSIGEFYSVWKRRKERQQAMKVKIDSGLKFLRNTLKDDRRLLRDDALSAEEIKLLKGVGNSDRKTLKEAAAELEDVDMHGQGAQ